MRLADRLDYAQGALIRHRGRSALQLLAIAAAVCSVLLLTGLGEGARRYVAAEFAFLGKDLLVMLPGRKQTTGGLPPLGASLHDITLDDMAFLARQLPRVRLAPLVVGNSQIRLGSRSRHRPVLGTTPEFLQTHRLGLLAGQPLPKLPPAQASPVCLLGQQLARELFGEASPLGQWIRIDDRHFRVLGLFHSASSNLGWQLDDSLLIPVGSAQALYNTQALFRLFIQARDGQPLSPLAQRLEQLMRQRHQGSLDVTLLQPDALLATFGDIMTTLTLAVAGIGAISLLVAGVMLMNLSLISARQRTAEVGLLKALGAPARLILQLLLTEALLLAWLGGLLGLALGYGLVSLAGWLYPAFPLFIPPWAAVAALLCALGTGLLFAWLPAARAARLPAVASLRGRV
ncbi:ABC transporter permease [Pseudaeromonas sp. ZJS20]|uniref:ABC transporter permease n=1 Tax=Pseudaeromonas aegiceratis TaxID=3153928 RepID=UPI00390C6934